MNTLVEIYSVDAEPNDPADASTGNDSVGFLVVTCEIPLTRMGNYLLNSLGVWLWYIQIYIQFELSSLITMEAEIRMNPATHAMVRFRDDSAHIDWCSRDNAEQFPPKFHGLVLGLVGLIDAKGIDLAQPIWP